MSEFLPANGFDASSRELFNQRMQAGAPKPIALGQPQRLHWLTPILKTWQLVLALLAFLAYQNLQEIRELSEQAENYHLLDDVGLVVLVVLVGVVAFLAIMGLYAYVSWRCMSYTLDAKSITLHQGIIFKNKRSVYLERIQSVDINRTLVARLLGLGTVRIESAGGSGSNLDLSYLKNSELAGIRAQLLEAAFAAKAPHEGAAMGLAQMAPGAPVPGVQPASQPGGQMPGQYVQGDHYTQAGQYGAGQYAAGAQLQEQTLYSVSTTRLIGSYLLTPALVVSAVAVIAIIITGVLALSGVSNAGAIMGAGFGVFAAASAMASSLWGRFNHDFNFSLAVSRVGLRLHGGLTQTYSRTLPPNRIHAVELTQPLMWRLKGWWRVEVLTAGVSGASEGTDSTGENKANFTADSLLPVGDWGQALYALWLVIPELASANPQALLNNMAYGVGTANPSGDHLWCAPGRTRWLDPLLYKRNAVAVTDTAVLIRAGRFKRRLIVLTHERSQSLALSQGPFERLVDVANIKFDMVPGPIKPVIRHLDTGQARQLWAHQAHRARMRRAAEENWLGRVSTTHPS
ncbi:hypothetical protein CJ186_08150 [Actinomyces graevenitzii]|uniref:PH domain-containing protein n=1 Tax=Actinomyces graevenitzii TaxID=55565 RepID=UPI000C806C53|nr:PH domain-containing protein [Actinomyces graevenitzii]PMC91123.1 hypothetical protein CJ186_08150 [Actinomyces graevenitzii]